MALADGLGKLPPGLRQEWVPQLQTEIEQASDRFDEVLGPTRYTPESKRIARVGQRIIKDHDPREAVVAAAKARVLVAAERRHEADRSIGVHPDDACLQAFVQAKCPAHVAGPHARGQSVGAVNRRLDHVLGTERRLHDLQHRGAVVNYQNTGLPHA